MELQNNIKSYLQRQLKKKNLQKQKHKPKDQLYILYRSNSIKKIVVMKYFILDISSHQKASESSKKPLNQTSKETGDCGKIFFFYDETQS